MILFNLSFNQTLQVYGIYLSDYYIKFCNIYMCLKYSKKDIQMKGSVCMRMKFKKNQRSDIIRRSIAMHLVLNTWLKVH